MNNTIRSQEIFWRKLSEDDLPESGKYVLVKFSNGKYDYFWQNWKEDTDPDKFKYPDLDEEPDTMFDLHKLYEVVEWAYLD